MKRIKGVAIILAFLILCAALPFCVVQIINVSSLYHDQVIDARLMDDLTPEVSKYVDDTAFRLNFLFYLFVFGAIASPILTILLTTYVTKNKTK